MSSKHFETQKVKYYVKNQKTLCDIQNEDSIISKDLMLDMIDQGCLKAEG